MTGILENKMVQPQTETPQKKKKVIDDCQSSEYSSDWLGYQDDFNSETIRLGILYQTDH